MKFKNIAEAFNHYRNSSLEDIETRAAEIKGTIEKDPKADIVALNIEISGLMQAKANQEEKQTSTTAERGFNPITGMNFEHRTIVGDVLDSSEYRSAFYKTMLGQDLTEQEKNAYGRATSEKRADVFSSASNSAAVLPTQTLNEVVKKARTQGGLIGVSRSFNIPSGLSVPVGTPSSSASWHVEGKKVDSEKPDVTNVTFDSNEILKIFSISAKVKRMSIPAFESYLIDELSACVMATIAESLVNGSGSGQGTGILSGITWSATNSLTYTGNVAYSDIVKTIAALKRGYSNGAVWAMDNTTLYNQLYSLTDTAKRPIFTPDPRNDGINRVLGFPVVVDDNLPAGTILFGNFNYMGYNLAEGIAIEKSTESSFKSGLIDYRAMAIADTKPIVDEAFIKLSASGA